MVLQESLGCTELLVETGGYCRFDLQPTNSRHKHTYFEACLVLSGTGAYWHGGREFALEAGDAFLAQPDVLHEISSYDTRDLELYFLILQASDLGGVAHSVEDRTLRRFLAHPRLHASGLSRLKPYLPLLESALPGVGEAASAAALRYFTLSLLEALTEPLNTVHTPQTHPEALARALRFMDANLHRNVDVEEIAACSGVSSRTLRRKFLAHVGCGIAEEFNHRRMRRAAHLLLMGFSVAESAEQVGISEAPQFTRAFQRAFQLSPKRFQSTYQVGRIARQTLPET